MANPKHEGTSTASGTTSVTGSEVEIEIQRKIISSTCEEPGCETNYKNSTYEGIMSLPDDELLRKPLEEDLMNLNSHLIGSHYFNPDLFSNGTAAIEMLPYLTANDTESWTAEELETWKTNFTEAVTEILMNSTTTVHELALLFGNYTADPEYLNEMQWASQELTEAIIDLTAGNTTLGYEHLHMSWQHSWNAMLLADTTPPHVCICSEKTYAWLQTPYELGGFCGYDSAGPVEYECLKEYNWDFGDGFGDSGIRVLHNYTALGTYQAVLQGLDRSDNSNTTSRQVRVTIRVDINGDWKVDVKDVSAAAKAFGTVAGPPPSLRWNPDVDIDANGKIDVKDIAPIARKFGWHYP